MKKLLILSFFGVGLLNLSVFGAGPWYVAKEDPNAADTLVEGRGTEALPFRTIQAALDNTAFEAGGTVYVKRGVYDEGGKMSSYSNWNMTNRVWITKQVYLKALDGRDVTHIVGKWSNTDDEGRAADSIRCIGVKGALGTVIEGFTLRDGASSRSGSAVTRAHHQGGGLLVGDDAKGVYLVDCVVSNCSAQCGGGMRGGTAIRCWFDRCNGTSRGSACDGVYAYACLFTRCYCKTTGSGRGVIGGSDLESVIVNSTFYGNTTYALPNFATLSAYNCVFAGNTATEIGANTTTSECTTTSTATEGAYQVFAPGFSDFRLGENATAIGLGKVANVQKLKELGVDETYLKKDFLGNVVDLTKDTLNAGAVQSVAVAATARIVFNDTAVVDGFPVAAGEWVASERFPVQYLVKPVVPEDKTFYSFVRTSTGSVVNDREPTFVYLQPDGQVRITPPPVSALATQTYTAQYAAAEFWTDPSAAEGGDGSKDSPFRKLQDVVDAVADDYTLIRAKKGDYREGGKAWSNLWARVDFYSGREESKKHVLLRAEEGPEATTIWGAADLSAAEDPVEPGCGENAVRCVLLNNYCAVQGFTLRDGHTFASSAATVGGATSDYRKNGAAVYTPQNNWIQPSQVLDCVITNCVGAKSIFYWGYTHRNRIVGNTVSGAVEHKGYHSTELVLNNTCGSFGTDGGMYFLSTFAGNTKSSGVDEFVNFYAGEYAYDCIVIGGRCARKMTADIGNFYWEQSTYASMSESSARVDPLLADAAGGDCRPYAYSPALGASPSDNIFHIYAGSDLNYGSLAIAADGKLSAGCFQSGLPSAAWFADRAGNVTTNTVEVGDALTRAIPSATHPNWQKGTVTLLDGYSFDVDWTAPGALREFAATVEGAGTLSVFVNGEPLGTATAADGTKPFSFRPSDDGDTVRFAYAGGGRATLAGFKSGSGLMLIFR